MPLSCASCPRSVNSEDPTGRPGELFDQDWAETKVDIRAGPPATAGRYSGNNGSPVVLERDGLPEAPSFRQLGALIQRNTSTDLEADAGIQVKAQKVVPVRACDLGANCEHPVDRGPMHIKLVYTTPIDAEEDSRSDYE